MDRRLGWISYLQRDRGCSRRLRLLNLLIPCETGEKEALPSEAAVLPSDLSEDDLDFVEREYRAAQAQAGERERNVQARLVGLLGLSSLVTALLSGFAALATVSDLQWPLLMLVFVLVAWLYVAVQAVASMLFTIRGLTPKAYTVLSPWGGSQKRSIWQRRHRLSRHITNLRRSVHTTNRRIDDMVLALRSLRRLAWGSALLLVVLVVIILGQRADILSDAHEPAAEPAATEFEPVSRSTAHR